MKRIWSYNGPLVEVCDEIETDRNRIRDEIDRITRTQKPKLIGLWASIALMVVFLFSDAWPAYWFAWGLWAVSMVLVWSGNSRRSTLIALRTVMNETLTQLYSARVFDAEKRVDLSFEYKSKPAQIRSWVRRKAGKVT